MTSFQRQDWTLFRNLGTLGQKAGVDLARLRRLVIKELVDNALDIGAKVDLERHPEGRGYIIEDDGPGIPGTPEQIADLFSIGRPLTSSKLRVPSRGALGNGLRVVAGAVLASDGALVVETRGMRLDLRFHDDGRTTVASNHPSPVRGTRIYLRLGAEVPKDHHDLMWGEQAIAFRDATSASYKGTTSCWWYDSDSFFELLLSAGDLPVPDLVARFDRLAAKVKSIPSFPTCGSMTRAQSESLLQWMRSESKPLKPERLVTREKTTTARIPGILTIRPGRGKFAAEVPYVVEAQAIASTDGDDDLLVYVNGTPITGRVTCYREKGTTLVVYGAGLHSRIERVSKEKFTLWINVITPAMPITTDGKEPDFHRIFEAVSKAARKATAVLKRSIKKSAGSQKDIICAHLPSAVAKASGNGTYRYSLRQLYYAVRPLLPEATLDYKYFATIITEYEAEYGELAGMYRDPRGVLYHPHTGDLLPIGTISVEDYQRPAFTFHRILYIEKEGFFEILRQAKWPERNDCALLSSKGFASRAVRDVLDLLVADDSEEIQVFCIHDADASGTLIYQALQEATRARPGRKVEIINLGLEPWEAVKLRLEVEHFTAKKPPAVARYVRRYSDENVDDTDWVSWLRGQRVELNSMTSPAFLAWLDSKMKPYVKQGKLVPPHQILTERLKSFTSAALRREISAQILAEQGFEDKVTQAMEEQDLAIDAKEVREALRRNPAQHWSEVVREKAGEMVRSRAAPPLCADDA